MNHLNSNKWKFITIYYLGQLVLLLLAAPPVDEVPSLAHTSLAHTEGARFLQIGKLQGSKRDWHRQHCQAQPGQRSIETHLFKFPPFVFDYTANVGGS